MGIIDKESAMNLVMGVSTTNSSDEESVSLMPLGDIEDSKKELERLRGIYQKFADDLKDFMDELDISRAVILGFSDGANIAMKFVLKYPERIKALILNGGNLNPKGVKPITQIPIEIGYRIVSKFASKSAGARKNVEMLGLMVNDPNIEAEELSKITVPTLVISGTKDMIKESHTKEIAKALPNAKLAIIEGSHFIASENPKVFNRVVEQWLSVVQHER